MPPTIPYPETGLLAKNTLIGYERDLWTPGGNFDYNVFQDNFWGDSLDVKYPIAKTNGASAAVTFTEHNLHGFLEFVTGTDSAGYAGQGLGLQFDGDRGYLADFLIKLPSSLATLKFEVGVSDVDNAAGAVNVKATPSFNVTDTAVFIFDTADNTQFDFITKGNSLTLQTTENRRALSASEFLRLSIRASGNTVEFWINGVKKGSHPASVEGGSPMTPWVFAQARTGSASRTVELHKWRVIVPSWT